MAAKDVYVGAELRFNKYSVSIASSGYNQMLVKKRSGNNVLVQLRYGSKRDEILEILESTGVQYNDQHRQFRFQMPANMFEQRADMFLRIAQLNKEWWVG